MAHAKTNKIYAGVIEITQDYLGPAASRFIDRSITNHLKIKPEGLSSADLKKLIDWVKVSVAVLTEDGDLVTEYVSRLNELSEDTKGKN